MADGLVFNDIATPSTPASAKSALFVGTDKRAKQIDSNGVISILNNDGLMERNVITNGGFNIQQKVLAASTAIASVSTTTRAGVVADCWSVTASVASNLNWQQVDTGSAPETGLNSRYYGSIIAATAGKKVMISQWILNAEMAHLRGLKVRVSVKTAQKVGSEGQTFRLGLLQLNSSGTADTSPAFLSGAWSTSTGTDPAWGTNLAAIAPDASPTAEGGTINGSYVDIISTLAWQRSSAVFTVPSNARNLVVVLFANATGGTTDNMSVAEFQLTQGTEIVEYIEPPHVETLMRCQRRYSKSFPIAIVPAASTTVANAGYGSGGPVLIAGSGTALSVQIPITFPVRMWKVPSITYYTPTAAGSSIYRHTGTTPAVQGATATVTNTLTDIGVTVQCTAEATVNATVGNWCSIHWAADAEIIA
jgi:hypothetical protein